MSYELKPLPYSYNALEPVIDAKTVEIHYSLHHQGYVNNLNKALEGSELGELCLCQLLQKLDEVPEAKRTAVRNNAGGAYNHKLYWEEMVPSERREPQGCLLKAIEEAFGSFDAFKEAFEAAGTSRFGSGWVWLVMNQEGKLQVLSTANQDNPISEGYKPLLGNDVWEHAYYLNYQNKRAAYLKAWWQLVNWEVVEARYAKHKEALSCPTCCSAK